MSSTCCVDCVFPCGVRAIHDFATLSFRPILLIANSDSIAREIISSFTKQPVALHIGSKSNGVHVNSVYISSGKAPLVIFYVSEYADLSSNSALKTELWIALAKFCTTLLVYCENGVLSTKHFETIQLLKRSSSSDFPTVLGLAFPKSTPRIFSPVNPKSVSHTLCSFLPFREIVIHTQQIYVCTDCVRKDDCAVCRSIRDHAPQGLCQAQRSAQCRFPAMSVRARARPRSCRTQAWCGGRCAVFAGQMQHGQNTCARTLSARGPWARDGRSPRDCTRKGPCSVSRRSDWEQHRVRGAGAGAAVSCTLERRPPALRHIQSLWKTLCACRAQAHLRGREAGAQLGAHCCSGLQLRPHAACLRGSVHRGRSQSALL
eukprot:comp15411_c0_seq2/m.23414 comp15411_c0_seq2/g.23414  ORF comp15411_c0_seq2/g.23414 comp15411_c0_seq2/m.23414 type:complete len:374 (-) comp15411_c0_seq2:803-1924(-)